MTLHVHGDLTQETMQDLRLHLAATTLDLAAPPDPVPSPDTAEPAPAPSIYDVQPAQDVVPADSADTTAATSDLFATARATSLGARTLQMIKQQRWQAIKADDEVKQWLSTHCIVCNVFVGTLKRMTAHMRQHHQSDIDGLYQLAGTVLKRCGTLSPCEFCQKTFIHEHLCPAIVQASMVLLHETPSPDAGPPPPADAALPSVRTRRLVVHEFVLARDSQQGIPKCSHCHRDFVHINGLRMHIALGKCSQFDAQRSQMPVAPDSDLIQHLKAGTLMLWLSDAHRRMQWSCHCKTCGMKFTGAAQLANHMQMTHATLWHNATTCTSFLCAFVHSIQPCVCNPSPTVVRNEHQCILLRQIAMQYVRARDLGQFPGLFLPYTLTAAELSEIMPYASADLCTLLCDVLRSQSMSPLWTSPLLQSLSERCAACGFEADGQPLTPHLLEVHSLALNSANLLQSNLAAMVIGYFQCCAQQPTCPLCAADFAGDTLHLHLVTCPILHQLAWSFSKPCHGRSRSGDGISASGPAGRRVSTSWTVAGQNQCEDPCTNDASTGRSAEQTFKRPGTIQEQGQGEGQKPPEAKRRRNSHDRRHPNIGKVGVAPRHATPPTASHLLPDLFLQQSRREHTPVSAPGLSELEATGGSRAGPKMSLRSTLWETVIQNVLQRALLLSKAKESDALMVKARKVGLVLEDGSWPYQEWCSHQKRLIPTKQAPRKMEAMITNLQALEDSCRDPTLVTSFHTMRPIPVDIKLDDEQPVEVYPWRLQLSQREDDPWNILLQLQGNAVWNLIGLRYKTSNLKPSALATQLDQQLRALR
eukprot:s700_g11.t1